MQCGDMPPLLLVGLACLILGILQGVGEVMESGLSGFRVWPGAWRFAFMGHLVYRICYFPALFLVDPIEAVILVQVWIASAIILSLSGNGGELKLRHVIGTAFLCAGVMAVIFDGIGAGHLMALCAGLWFGWFVVKSPGVQGLDGKAGALGNLAAGGLASTGRLP